MGKRGKAERTGLPVVSVPVPLTQMGEFVCNLVEFSRCDPLCDHVSCGFGVRLFCLV